MAELRIDPKGRDFDILPEVLVLLYSTGLSIVEVPFHYRPRRNGRSRVRLLRCGWSYLNTLLRMRKLRYADPVTKGPLQESKTHPRKAHGVRRSVTSGARRP
jgi:hypothetical protein